MGITHTYVSAVPDDGNPNKVGSSEWNAAHTVAAQSIVTADIADANVTLGKMAASSVDSSKIVAGTLDGVQVKEGAASYANGMIPLVYAFNIAADGSAGSTTVTNKFYIYQFWIQKLTNEASGSYTVTVRNGSDICGYINVISSFNAEGCIIAGDHIIVPAYQTVADGGTISATAAGASNMACMLGVLGVRVT